MEVVMRKIALLAVAFVLIGLVAGCGGNGDTESENGGNGGEPAQWAAYAFDQDVSPSSGGSGTVESFTIVETISEEGDIREFRIQGTYEGKGNQIETERLEVDLSTYESSQTTVSTSVQCYQLKHRVTVLRDDTGEEHPDWADITVWIPTGDIETTTEYFWIYPKSSYVDSDGNAGEWSYYLTDEMQDEMQNPPAGKQVVYSPYMEGDFYGYDGWMLQGLYGWGYYWFHAFAAGGDEYLEEDNWSVGGYSYSSGAVTRSVGDYTFDAWEISVSWAAGGESGGYSAVFSADLPMPIYLKVGEFGGDSADYFEYELTDLVLE
jgi:hypothetical protein